MRHPSNVYEQLREHLRESLVTPGDAGDRLPSERQLAKDFDVSPVTVSRALQELQNEGVVRRIPGKGTYITSEQNLLSGKTDSSAKSNGPQVFESPAPTFPWQMISAGRHDARLNPNVTPHALIIANLSSDPLSKSHEYWGARAISSLERRIQKCGGRTTVLDPANIAETDLAETELLEQWHHYAKDGINSVVTVDYDATLFPDLWGSLWLQAQAGKADVPFAVVQMLFAPGDDWPFDAVRFSDAWGAQLATQHLWNQGHRKLVFFSPSFELSWARKRYDSFRRTLMALGVSDAPLINTESTDTYDFTGDVSLGALRLLRELPDCSAVVAANDVLAQTLMRVAGEQGRAVPQNLSVIGFDDWKSSVQKGLTTVHIPVEEMAEAAAALLMQRLNEPETSERLEVSINPSLIVRSSTRAPS